MFETGTGIAFSFMKGDRYYEVGSLQYRARSGKKVTERLDLIEVGLDLVNLYRLVK